MLVDERERSGTYRLTSATEATNNARDGMAVMLHGTDAQLFMAIRISVREEGDSRASIESRCILGAVLTRWVGLSRLRSMWDESAADRFT